MISIPPVPSPRNPPAATCCGERGGAERWARVVALVPPATRPRGELGSCEHVGNADGPQGTPSPPLSSSHSTAGNRPCQSDDRRLSATRDTCTARSRRLGSPISEEQVSSEPAGPLGTRAAARGNPNNSRPGADCLESGQGPQVASTRGTPLAPCTPCPRRGLPARRHPLPAMPRRVPASRPVGTPHPAAAAAAQYGRHLSLQACREARGAPRASPPSKMYNQGYSGGLNMDYAYRGGGLLDDDPRGLK